MVTGHFSTVTSNLCVVTGHFSMVTSHFCVVTGHFSMVTSHFCVVTGHFLMVTSYFCVVTSDLCLVTNTGMSGLTPWLKMCSLGKKLVLTETKHAFKRNVWQLKRTKRKVCPCVNIHETPGRFYFLIWQGPLLLSTDPCAWSSCCQRTKALGCTFGSRHCDDGTAIAGYNE